MPADDIRTPRDFERFLREHGFSVRSAKAITRGGFRAAEERAESAELAAFKAKLRHTLGLDEVVDCKTETEPDVLDERGFGIQPNRDVLEEPRSGTQNADPASTAGERGSNDHT